MLAVESDRTAGRARTIEFVKGDRPVARRLGVGGFRL